LWLIGLLVLIAFAIMLRLSAAVSGTWDYISLALSLVLFGVAVVQLYRDGKISKRP
jgi:hypothetical protein